MGVGGLVVGESNVAWRFTVGGVLLETCQPTPQPQPSGTAPRSGWSLDSVDEDAERVDYWLSRPAEERPAAIETLRRAWQGENYTSAGLPGVLVITHQT
jgi:hypothetical protein